MTLSGYRVIAYDRPASRPTKAHNNPRSIVPLFALLATLLVSPLTLTAPYQGWSLPGADEGGGHFSQATQITPDNVTDLEIAWTHRSGDFREGENFIGGLSGEEPLQSSWQATPVLIEDHLYLCTPFNRILAIHAETGAERWSYSPDIDLESFPMPRCRGVTQWTDKRVPPTEPCHRVVIAPVSYTHLRAHET